MYFENPDDFFNTISNLIENYSSKPYKSTTLTINLGEINISSSKFHQYYIPIENIYKSGFQVKIRWIYKNGEDGNYELGKDYSEMASVPFGFY